MRFLWRALFVCTILGLVAAVGALAYAQWWFETEGDLPEETTVLIAPGTGFSSITQTLTEAGVINQPLLFKGMVVLQDKQKAMKAGEYLFPAHVSPKAVMERLAKGESITYSVTIPEGWTVEEIKQLLLRNDRLTGDVPPMREGYVMPDTYHFHRDESREAMVGRMQAHMQEAIDALWPKRADGLPFDTPHEALVLASIVEKETGLDQERGRVAAVFVNRLRKGMPLQSDPTVIYGIEKASGEPLGRPLWRKDLKIDHPYNTYVHAGLPPRPIANPGRAALEAVLNPPSTNEYYFVATGTGGHHFARTLAEHNRNVAKYKAELRRQKAAQ